MAYCKGYEAVNLRNRFDKKLKSVDVQKKDPPCGFRWLKPDDDKFLVRGELKRERGRKPTPLFTLVGELLPRESWLELPERLSGVYILFDSAETARYVGISSDMRKRLDSYFNGDNSHDDEKRQVVTAFSVYAVTTRQRARELESMLIHALGPQLILNQRKHRHFGERPGCDLFEPGTLLLRRKEKYPYVGVETMLDFLVDDDTA